MSRFVCPHPTDHLLFTRQFAICQRCARIYRPHHPLYPSLLKRYSIWEVRQSLIEGHQQLQQKLGTTDMEVLSAYAAQGADLTTA